jgi:hypothetical protein
MPCPAFARNEGGSWTIVAPGDARCRRNGDELCHGHYFRPRHKTHGVAIPDILNREYGNR